MNNKIKSLWLTETVRQVEYDSGPFNDEDANRQAKTIDGSDAERIIKRAEIIGKQNGLIKAQNEWLTATKISIFLLTIVAVFLGVGLAFTALSQQPVNLYWALTSLLGLHVITFIIWIITFLFLPTDSGSLLIQIWLWLTKKLNRKQTVSQLFPAYISLFGKQIRWFIGFLVNLIWTIILTTALIVLIALLSTKNYSFEWQTTLLSADNIISLTYLLGKVPSLFGFLLPNIDVIRSSAQAIPEGEVRSAWAIWLLGIFIIYGLLLRLIAMLICGITWLVVNNRVALNIEYPEYQMLIQKFQTSKAIIDVQHDGLKTQTTYLNNGDIHNSTLCGLVAIDIEESWNPPENIKFFGFLNRAEERKNILDFLQNNPAQRLLIAIDTDRTPDRGMINLLMQLQTKTSQCKLWFINSGRQLQNWQQTSETLNIPQSNIDWLQE